MPQRFTAILSFSLAFLSATTLALGQEAFAQVRVTGTVNSTDVSTGEHITFSVEVEGVPFDAIERPDPPHTVGLSLLHSLPSTSRNVEVSNGVVRQSMRFSWTMTPTREGVVRIDPLDIITAGRSYSTEPIRIRVAPSSQRNSPAVAGGDGAETGGDFGAEDIYIRARPSKISAYLHEQVVIEYRLFFREGVQLRQSRLAGSWDAPGFWREELEVDLRPHPDREVVNGTPYQSILLKRVAVFPTRTGTLNIQPLRIETEARPRESRSFFDSFFGVRNQFRTIDLASSEIQIDVRPLPPNPPAGFTGAVGDFRVSTHTSREPLAVGDPLQRRINIQGSGNVALIQAPELDAPSAFDVHSPQVTESTDRRGKRLEGRKSFDYTAVPMRPGRYELPPLHFSYFDPQVEAYQTVESPSVLLEVEGDDVADGAIANRSALSEIAIEAEWQRTSGALHRNPAAYAPLAGALVAWLLLPGVKRARSRRRQVRSSAASKSRFEHWQRDLERLRDSDASRKTLHAYRSLTWSVVGTVLGESAENISHYMAVRRVEENNVSLEVKAALRDALLILERSGYAPGRPDQRSLDELGVALETAILALAKEDQLV